jgi:hypothetical protein
MNTPASATAALAGDPACSDITTNPMTSKPGNEMQIPAAVNAYQASGHSRALYKSNFNPKSYSHPRPPPSENRGEMGHPLGGFITEKANQRPGHPAVVFVDESLDIHTAHTNWRRSMEANRGAGAFGSLVTSAVYEHESFPQ